MAQDSGNRLALVSVVGDLLFLFALFLFVHSFFVVSFATCWCYCVNFWLWRINGLREKIGEIKGVFGPRERKGRREDRL